MEQDLTTEEQHDAAGLGSLLSARVQSCMHADTCTHPRPGEVMTATMITLSAAVFILARIFFYYNMEAGRVRSIKNRDDSEH